jgi:hypothetical protein
VQIAGKRKPVIDLEVITRGIARIASVDVLVNGDIVNGQSSLRRIQSKLRQVEYAVFANRKNLLRSFISTARREITDHPIANHVVERFLAGERKHQLRDFATNASIWEQHQNGLRKNSKIKMDCAQSVVSQRIILQKTAAVLCGALQLITTIRLGKSVDYFVANAINLFIGWRSFLVGLNPQLST